MRYMWTAWTAYIREYVNIKTYALHSYILKISKTEYKHLGTAIYMCIYIYLYMYQEGDLCASKMTNVLWDEEYY